mmetsp:Transcript_20546/g.46618  ORF Transcript_20546/g.46618 Transcript_20546/m.46618 type:complete len:402 (-) Transcript_20546:247-1452(-)
MNEMHPDAQIKTSDQNFCFIVTREGEEFSYGCENEDFTLLLERRAEVFKTTRFEIEKRMIVRSIIRKGKKLLPLNVQFSVREGEGTSALSEGDLEDFITAWMYRLISSGGNVNRNSKNGQSEGSEEEEKTNLEKKKDYAPGGSDLHAHAHSQATSTKIDDTEYTENSLFCGFCFSLEGEKFKEPESLFNGEDLSAPSADTQVCENEPFLVVKRDDHVRQISHKNSDADLRFQRKAIKKIFESENRVDDESKLNDGKFIGTNDVNEKNKNEGYKKIKHFSGPLTRDIKNEVQIDNLFKNDKSLKSENQDNESNVNKSELTGDVDVDEKNKNEEKEQIQPFFRRRNGEKKQVLPVDLKYISQECYTEAQKLGRMLKTRETFVLREKKLANRENILEKLKNKRI